MELVEDISSEVLVVALISTLLATSINCVAKMEMNVTIIAIESKPPNKLS
jgi:hypothetical protein